MSEDDLEAKIRAAIGTPIGENDREALNSLVELIRSLILQMVEQTAGMGRWLLASLLAVNGGAIIAVLNSAAIAGEAEKWAIALWFVGIILAIGSGTLSMYNGQQGISVASNLLGGVIQTLQTGTWQDFRFNAQREELERRGRRAIMIGVLSEIAFIIGAVIAAAGL